MIDILRSEWTKIRSVRSTMWTLGVTGALMLGFSALINLTAENMAQGRPVPGEETLSASLTGVMFASLAMATLGVLVISGEYRTGSIRTSLMAVPQRLMLLAGKLVAFSAVALVVCTVAAAGAIVVGVVIAQPPSLTAGEMVRAALGAGLYLSACGLFGLGLGSLIRHTPGAIVSAIALIMVLPTLTGQLPGEWGRTVSEYFTTNAGLLVVSGQSNGSLGPWSGFAVYLVWVAVAVVAGAVLMKRRDA
ncbi:ABC transporter permease subunit [Nonomuraea sp. NPDC050394]|uniref:ABC transporter permease subunit n=1 Tax=Nonomuraea sp. NPDC050394 TaxID=3364363 RepID=UPI003790EA7E